MGAFSFLTERLGENPPGFDKFVRNEFGQPKAGPVAQSAEGLGAWVHSAASLVCPEGGALSPFWLSQ